jgi:hypothetical protein
MMFRWMSAVPEERVESTASRSERSGSAPVMSPEAPWVRMAAKALDVRLAGREFRHRGLERDRLAALEVEGSAVDQEPGRLARHLLIDQAMGHRLNVPITWPNGLRDRACRIERSSTPCTVPTWLAISRTRPQSIATQKIWRVAHRTLSSGTRPAWPCTTRDGVRETRRWRIGVVARVVARAMRTIIANSFGEMTLRSSPILSTISSISPRVFSKMPKAAASR